MLQNSGSLIGGGLFMARGQHLGCMVSTEMCDSNTAEMLIYAILVL